MYTMTPKAIPDDTRPHPATRYTDTYIIPFYNPYEENNMDVGSNGNPGIDLRFM